MILTKEEINKCAGAMIMEGTWSEAFALAIQEAVIAKLVGVSVEPSYYWEPDGTIEWMKEGSGFSTNTGPAHGWKITHYYTATAIAAARVQALEEAVTVCEGASSFIEHQQHLLGARDCVKAIRALIGGAT